MDEGTSLAAIPATSVLELVEKFQSYIRKQREEADERMIRDKMQMRQYWLFGPRISREEAILLLNLKGESPFVDFPSTIGWWPMKTANKLKFLANLAIKETGSGANLYLSAEDLATIVEFSGK